MQASFAVQAQHLIDAGKPEKAVALCADGIAAFPEYLGGYVVLAKAYGAIGRHRDANLILDEAIRLGFRDGVATVSDIIAVPDIDTTPLVEVPDTTAPAEQEVKPDLKVVSDIIAVPDIDTTSQTEVPDTTTPAVQEVEPDLVEVVSDIIAVPNIDTTSQAEVPDITIPAEQEVKPDLKVVSDIVAPVGNKVVHKSTPFLHVIDTAQLGTPDSRIIRAASIRLIPGLEYTTLRFEGMKVRGRREIRFLNDPPPFRTFHTRKPSVASPLPVVQQTPVAPVKKRLSLEELASRLEKARMPRPSDTDQRAQMPALHVTPIPAKQESVSASVTQATSLVTETIARIYAQQGAYEKAIEAYTALMARYPERVQEFTSVITTLKTKLNVT